MLINLGTQERLLAESTLAAGVSAREGSVRSDGILVSLWVGSLPAGSLTVEAFTLTDEGEELELLQFPVVTGPTTQLLLRKAPVSLQRFRIRATYTGACDYKVYVRGVSGDEVPDTQEKSLEILSQALISDSNFLRLANPDLILPVVSGNQTTIQYYEDSALIAEAVIIYNSSSDWSISLLAYINDDDGIQLQDDDGSQLLLE